MTPPRIAVCVASSGNCKTQFAMSFAGLMAYFPTRPLMVEQPEQHIAQFLVESSSIAYNQHRLVEAARDWKATHILWLEDDMKFPPEALHMLFARRQMWVGANYPIRSGPPFTNTALAFDQSRVRTRADSTGLEACLYTGYGCALMDVTIFDKVETPWFEFPWKGDGNYATSDWYFSEKVRAAGIPIYVDHDLSKLIGHVGSHTYNVAEVEAWEAMKSQQEKSNG